MKLLKGYTFNIPKVKCIIECPADTNSKLLLLDESLTTGTLDGLPEPVQAEVQHQGFQVTSHDVQIGYSQLSASDILRKILPEDVEVPGSFETIGSIAHYNLRPGHVPYKHLIGQVCLDKNPAIKTVVTKVKEIENEFRVFEMEVIAGDDSFETEVSQHGMCFRLDFSKVFWNSRLEHEHHRLVNKYFRPGQVVIDVMAGIGPFAVPAAKLGCRVLANDLNPDSFKWLQENIRINKVADNVHCFCLDGRDFVRMVNAAHGWTHERIQSVQAECERLGETTRIPAGWARPDQGVVWHHAIMNLPRTAVSFCDAFAGTFSTTTWQGPLPLVHCYSFQKSETEQDVISRVEAALGARLDEPATVHKVRLVAPDKHHVCITFRVPRAVAFEDAGPQTKRSKTQNV
eukprot:jgi/Ulvmu1/253/UM001_0257.1